MNHQPCWEPRQPLSMSHLTGSSISILRKQKLFLDSSGRSTHLEYQWFLLLGFMPGELQFCLRAGSEDLDGPSRAWQNQGYLAATLPDTTYTTGNGRDSLNKENNYFTLGDPHHDISRHTSGQNVRHFFQPLYLTSIQALILIFYKTYSPKSFWHIFWHPVCKFVD